MTKVVLGAGHYKGTPGKQTPDGTKEWVLNNAVASKVEEMLVDYDVDIIRADDKTGNTDVSLDARCEVTTSQDPDMYLSIHHNAFKGYYGSWTGYEVYYMQGISDGTRATDAVTREEIWTMMYRAYQLDN